MREVDVNEIIKNIKEMCIEANHFLSKDMKEVYDAAAVEEESPLGRQILGQLQENLQIAGEDMIPICQDTGMAVVFVKVGQEVQNPLSKTRFTVKILRTIHRQLSIMTSCRVIKWKSPLRQRALAVKI